MNVPPLTTSPPMASEPLVVVGGSVRAAVGSAIRAGLTPYACDAFGDRDLTAACVSTVAEPYPAGIVKGVQAFPRCEWVYTGGLENHPQLVARLAADRPLLGNGPAVLKRVRSIELLHDAMARAGFTMPEMRSVNDETPRDGSWLIKRRHSTGGLHVQPWMEATRMSKPRQWYLQRRVVGRAIGASFVGNGSQAAMIGVSQSMVLERGLDGASFLYAGSIAPVVLSPTLDASLRQLGDVLVGEFQLVGLFGVDAMVDEEERLWVLEVNPRYTASIELFERAMGIRAMTWHVDACRNRRLPDDGPTATNNMVGKMVVYTNERRVITAVEVERWESFNRGGVWPRIADIPQIGSIVEQGQPIATVFGLGESEEAVMCELGAMRSQVEARGGEWVSG